MLLALQSLLKFADFLLEKKSSFYNAFTAQSSKTVFTAVTVAVILEENCWTACTSRKNGKTDSRSKAAVTWWLTVIVTLSAVCHDSRTTVVLRFKDYKHYYHLVSKFFLLTFKISICSCLPCSSEFFASTAPSASCRSQVRVLMCSPLDSISVCSLVIDSWSSTTCFSEENCNIEMKSQLREIIQHPATVNTSQYFLHNNKVILCLKNA